jgi:purine-binding chemotaxis protein CheW
MVTEDKNTTVKEEPVIGSKSVSKIVSEHDDTSSKIQLIVFKLGEEEYGVNIQDTKEIITARDITPVPNAEPHIAGIINLRGQIVTVINLQKKFNMELPAHETGHIIVADHDGNLFGVLVDIVVEVMKIPENNIKKVPSVVASKIDAKFLAGVGVVSERLIILLNFPNIISGKAVAKTAPVSKELIAKEEAPKENNSSEEELTQADLEEKFKKKFAEDEKKIKAEKTPLKRKTKKPALKTPKKKVKKTVKGRVKPKKTATKKVLKVKKPIKKRK